METQKNEQKSQNQSKSQSSSQSSKQSKSQNQHQSLQESQEPKPNQNQEQPQNQNQNQSKRQPTNQQSASQQEEQQKGTPRPKKRKAKRKRGWVPVEEREKAKSTIIIDKTNAKSTENFDEAKYLMLISELVPDYLLNELYVLTGCECPMDAVALFMQTDFSVSRTLQAAINKFHFKIHKAILRPTSCAACMRRRVQRIRNYLTKKGL